MNAHTGALLAAVVDTADAYGDADFTLADAGIPTEEHSLLLETGLVVVDNKTVVDWSDATPVRAREHPNWAPIRLLRQENPKRGKSAERFALYSTSATVGDYIAACVAAGYSSERALADIRWDINHEFISVETD